MKKLLIIFLLLFSSTVFAQQIWFQMQRVNYCTKTVTVDSSIYYLVDKFGVNYRNIAGKVWLKEKGTYEIYYPKSMNTVFPTIHITDNETVYTYIEPKIRFAAKNWGMSFQNCEGLLNGFHEDFYENGNPHIRGNFVNGLPKDSLVMFYYNGHIKRSTYYLSTLNIIQEYDSLGTLRKVSRNSNKLPVITDYNATTFFENGSLQSREKVKNRSSNYVEYYPSRKLKTTLTKNKRTEYFTDGSPEMVFTWKHRNLKDGSLMKRGFEIRKIVYTEKGQIKEDLKYFSQQGNIKQPKLNFNDADYIFYWKKYNDLGEEKVLYKNVGKLLVKEIGGFITNP